MNTVRILKVLALAMEANPNLPIPLTLDNIDLDDITATPGAKRNTAATMYARDTGEIVRYVGNSGVVYDRINIATYWRPDDIVESPTATTVGDLAEILRNRFGLDVLDSEIKNADAPLPEQGTVRIVIDDSVSPLYIGQVDILFAKDAGFAGTDGMEYIVDGGSAGSQPVVGYVDNLKDKVEVSIDHGHWMSVTPVRNNDTFQIVSPVPFADATANVRIRGAKSMVMDYDNQFVRVTRLITYKSFNDATGYFAGILTLTEVAEDAFKHREELTSADYLFDGCRNLATIPEHLFSYCSNLVSAKAALRRTAITSIPETVLESCAKLTDVSMMFEQCTNVRVLPARIFATNTALKTVSRCFMGMSGIVDEIPEGILATLVNLEDASYLFAGNPWVTTLPDNLLTGCVQVKNLTGFFSRCVNLMVIPSDLLHGLTALRNINAMFEGCTTIASIPPGLFQGNLNLEYAEYAFASTGILTTPAVMFTYTRKLLSIDYIFSNCVKLIAIPDGLMQPLLRLQSMNGVWMNCLGITVVPSGLFSQNKNVVSADWLFAGSGLTAVDSLFTANVKLVSLEGAFARTKLVTLPANLFSGLTELINLNQAFHRCSQLTEIPPELLTFSNALTNLRGAFAYCVNLTSNIGTAFSLMSPGQRNAITAIAGLYQGSPLMQGTFGTDLRTVLTGVDWMSTTAPQGCVAGLTALTDYATIGTVYKTPVPGLM